MRKRIYISEEQQTLNYILSGNSLNESLAEGIVSRFAAAAKKGLLTAAIVASVLPRLSAQEQQQVLPIARQAGITVVTDTQKHTKPHIAEFIITVPSANAEKEAKTALVNYAKEHNLKDIKIVQTNSAYEASTQNAKVSTLIFYVSTTDDIGTDGKAITINATQSVDNAPATMEDVMRKSSADYLSKLDDNAFHEFQDDLRDGKVTNGVIKLNAADPKYHEKMNEVLNKMFKQDCMDDYVFFEDDFEGEDEAPAWFVHKKVLDAGVHNHM